MKLLIMFLLVCVAVVSVQAQDVYQWFGGEPANSDWNYGMNWKTEYCESNPAQNGTFGTVPDARAKTKHNNVLWGSVASVIIDEAITIGDVFMVDAGHLTPEDVTVATGGSLLVQGALGAGGGADGQVNIAYAFGGTARLIIDGGNATVLGPVHIGWGGTGQVIIGGGGSLTVNGYSFGGAGGSGSVLFTAIGGSANEWILNGLFVAGIQTAIDDGKITTNVPGAHVEVVFDSDLGQTLVYATPEPITISLLGLGALMLRRRS